VQSLGLAAEYKNSESDVGNWIKSFFGLSYLDPNDVEDCFAFDLFPCALNVEKAHEFADYILRNYQHWTLDFYSQQPNQGSALSSNKIVKGETDILLYQFLAILLGRHCE
jgi:hypothetical protein